VCCAVLVGLDATLTLPTKLSAAHELFPALLPAPAASLLLWLLLLAAVGPVRAQQQATGLGSSQALLCCQTTPLIINATGGMQHCLALKPATAGPHLPLAGCQQLADAAAAHEARLPQGCLQGPSLSAVSGWCYSTSCASCC